MKMTTLSRVLTTTASAVSRNLSVAIPGKVTSYDAASNTCSVVPAVARLLPSDQNEDVEDVVEDLAEIHKVPVCWPSGHDFKVKGNLSAGDSVLLVVCDRDIDNWRRTGDLAEPDDGRMHDYDFSVAIPGLWPASGKEDPEDALALASKVNTELQQLRDTVLQLQIAFAAHTHPTAPAGPVSPPTTPPSPPTMNGTISTLLTAFGAPGAAEPEDVSSAIFLTDA